MANCFSVTSKQRIEPSSGKGFKRTEDENEINGYLNYAYTVLRSAVARSLVLYGWLPQLGLFHRSELNAFNLADDFIEPFRPMVDLFVWQLWQEEKLTTGLTPIAKQRLIKVLHFQMCFKKETFSVLAAIEKSVASLQAALVNKDANLLKLPEILPLMEHQYE